MFILLSESLLFIPQYVCLSFSLLSTCCLSNVYPSACLPVYLCLSACLSVFLSVVYMLLVYCLSLCLSICLFVPVCLSVSLLNGRRSPSTPPAAALHTFSATCHVETPEQYLSDTFLTPAFLVLCLDALPSGHVGGDYGAKFLY